MKKRKHYSELAKMRIAWRRGAWCSVQDFLRGQHKTQVTGVPEQLRKGEYFAPLACDVRDTDGEHRIPMRLRLDQLEGKLR